MNRSVLLALVALLSLGSAPAQAQTIPSDSLARLVMRVQVAEPDSGHAASPYEVPPQQPSFLLVSNPDEFGHFVRRVNYDPEAERLVGFSTDFAPNDLFESATLEAPEEDLLITVLNDLVQFEGALSVVALWKREGDRLKLLHLLPEAFPQRIGRVGADSYAVFPDGSLLLVLRQVGEGVLFSTK